MWCVCVFCLSFSTLIEFSSIEISLSFLVKINKSQGDDSYLSTLIYLLIVVNLWQIVQQKIEHEFGDLVLFIDRVANLFSVVHLLPHLLVELWLLFNSIEFRNDALNHKLLFNFWEMRAGTVTICV